jgi:FixJ family two-component response regulator
VKSTVHVVDDDASFRTAIERRLKMAGYDVATYETAQQLLDSLPGDKAPGCILLDVEMPGLTGPELQQRLGQLGSVMPIVFLTGHGDIPTSVQAMKIGADDFLTKPVSSEDLLHAIEKALAHHEVLLGQREKLRAMRCRIASLTPREKEVFDLLVQGNINKQIAFELGTTERTIKAHRQSVMEKMQVQSLAELVSIAERVPILGMLARPGTRVGIESSIVPMDNSRITRGGRIDHAALLAEPISLIRHPDAISIRRGQAERGSSVLPKGKVVFVVDDDPSTLKGVKRLLREHGFDCILFESAAALQNNNDFDLAFCIVLDINLNDGSGIEVRHRLTAAGISLPVIYITANDNPATQMAAIESGCIAYLTKPFSAKSLIEPIARVSAGLA